LGEDIGHREAVTTRCGNEIDKRNRTGSEVGVQRGECVGECFTSPGAMDDFGECWPSYLRRCVDETFDGELRSEPGMHEEDEGVDGIWERGNPGSGG
jgi:hypothetical protein